ncbi:MAG: SemiSWEET transporter [Candidatus Omnitrophota bacterium]|jgi:MtN3 and saliva related transmembrane protein
MLWPVVGSTAALLTMFAFIPQIIKAWKTKSVKDVSLITLLQLSLGVSLWVSYGVYLRDPIIIVANSVTLVSLIILLLFYFCL